MTEQLQTVPTLKRWLLLAVVALLGAGLWAAERSDAASTSVAIQGFSFQPQEITVHPGDTVTWTNNDSEAHAVQGGAMNSPDIQPGQSFAFTFNQVGDVNYICRIHTYMNGVVHVVNGGTTSSTTSTTAAPTTTTTAPASTTTTTAGGGGGTTTTTTPGETTTTTAPDGSTTTTTAPPSSGDGPAFQEVPDDPSAQYPPGDPRANTPPPQGAGTTTTTSTTAPSTPPDPQDVPNDPSGEQTPGQTSGDSGGGGGGGGGSGMTDLGDGTFLAPFTTDGGVKVFRLSMAPTTIETAPGVTKEAYAFNGIVPGPVLRVNEGDKVRIIVDNKLPFATTVHWHGMILPNDQDGVGGITQPFIEPGQRYTYEWTAVATGTHWYHAHSSGRHIGKGLYGALEVIPKTGDFQADRDYRLLLGDTDLGFVINGRMFPSTKTLVTKVGETVHLRIIATGDQVHAMHLHGTAFEVVAQDGNKLPQPVKMDTLTISPGQTYDLLATETNPGKWLLHCHIFAHSHMSMDEHMAGDSGMTGMVTILDTAPADATLPPSPLVTTPIASASGHHTRLPLPSVPGGDFSPVLAAAIAVVLSGLRTGRRRPSLFNNPQRKDITQ
jgi:plastocyanin